MFVPSPPENYRKITKMAYVIRNTHAWKTLIEVIGQWMEPFSYYLHCPTCIIYAGTIKAEYGLIIALRVSMQCSIFLCKQTLKEIHIFLNSYFKFGGQPGWDSRPSKRPFEPACWMNKCLRTIDSRTCRFLHYVERVVFANHHHHQPVEIYCWK